MAYLIYYKHNRPNGITNLGFEPNYEEYFLNRQAVWNRYGTASYLGIVDDAFFGPDTSPTSTPWQPLPSVVEVADPSVFQAMHDEIDSHPLATELTTNNVSNVITMKYKIINSDTQEVVVDWTELVANTTT